MPSKIFENYQNLPAGFVPSDAEMSLCDNRLARKPLEEYGASGELIGYSWVYGDAVILLFTTSGSVTDDSTELYQTATAYMSGKTLRFRIIDFRLNTVLEKTMDASTSAEFDLSEGESASLGRGVYSCELALIDGTTGLETILFGRDNGSLYVR